MAVINTNVYRYSPKQVTDSTLASPTATSVQTRLAADLAADNIESSAASNKTVILHITCAEIAGEIVYTVLHA